jgi:hypothetical protein
MNKPDQSEIGSVLADARIALLAGNLIELTALPERLERAFAASKPVSLKDAQGIRALAAQNDVLLVAALKGVRAAKQRLQDLSQSARFSIYESNGQRQQPGVGSERTSRRF